MKETVSVIQVRVPLSNDGDDDHNSDYNNDKCEDYDSDDDYGRVVR